MILVVRIKLTSHLLGELRPDHKQVRRFRKENGNVAVNITQWQEIFREAAQHIGLTIDPKTIEPKSNYRPASIHLYRRVFSRVHTEWFESFRKGTVITFEMVLHEQRPKAPSPHELKAILAFVGEYTGISQFGSKFGFGRFQLLSVDVKDFLNPA